MWLTAKLTDQIHVNPIFLWQEIKSRVTLEKSWFLWQRLLKEVFIADPNGHTGKRSEKCTVTERVGRIRCLNQGIRPHIFIQSPMEDIHIVVFGGHMKSDRNNCSSLPPLLQTPDQWQRFTALVYHHLKLTISQTKYWMKNNCSYSTWFLFSLPWQILPLSLSAGE